MDNGLLFEGFTQRGQVYQTIVDDNRSFTENHSLFYMGGIYQWEAMTDMQDDFGVIPLPKYDEKQERYYARGLRRSCKLRAGFQSRP